MADSPRDSSIDGLSNVGCDVVDSVAALNFACDSDDDDSENGRADNRRIECDDDGRRCHTTEDPAAVSDENGAMNRRAVSAVAMAGMDSTRLTSNRSSPAAAIAARVTLTIDIGDSRRVDAIPPTTRRIIGHMFDR
jgi:hypothetical protein